MKHHNNFYWLDLLRGIAAILVFLSHSRALFFLDYNHIDHTILSSLFYFITGFGHPAVIIFFTLSGFFIIGSIDNSVSNNRWSFINYITDRLVRLWVVLIPALFLTYLLDSLGLKLYPDSLAYTGAINSIKDINPIGRSNGIVFLSNVLFLQNILTPTFGSNTPLWSLSCEFWYYFLFPFIYFALSKKNSIWIKIVGLMIPILLLALSHTILFYFPIWLMGGVVYYFYKHKNPSFFSRNLILFCVLFLFFSTLIFIRLDKYPFIFNDYSLGISSSLAIISLTQIRMKSLYLKNISKFTSNISFTLYLVHLPLSIILITAISPIQHDFNYTNAIFFSILFILIIAFSYFFWSIFEKNTPYIKNWVKSSLIPKLSN